MAGFWLDKRVFITGANGFLGSHFTKAVLGRGNCPYVLIYQENPGSIFDQERLASKTHLIRGDVRDLELLARIFREHRIDSIFHLAAQALVDQAIDDPLETFEANIQGTWNVLEAAKMCGQAERIIVASSDKAYGHHDNLPYQEHTHELKAAYSYEVSKACADLISQSYWRTFHLPICITRSSNLYGAGDLKFNRLIPNTLRRLYYDQPPIIRDAGDSLRDYLYVEDAVEGYIELAEHMDRSIFGEAFNFATNKPLSVSEVIAIITREMGKNIEPMIIKTRGLEIRHQYASYEKAKKVLGWEPKHTFIEGLAKTIPWYNSHFDNAGTRE